MTEALTNFWKKCSVCKNPIGLNSTYYVCSVSTCNGQRSGYVFCRYQCFETHLPGARHRDAAAVEMRSPSTPASPEAERTPTRLIVRPSANPSAAPQTGSALPREVLVIASRLKDYIQARGDMNTAAAVMDVLSDHLRQICDRAIEEARQDGRKTVMERDLSFLRNLK